MAVQIMCKAIDKNFVCCLPTYPRMLALCFLLSEFWAGFFFQIVFTRVICGRFRQRCALLEFSVPGRPTVLDNCRAHCAYSRCGWGLFRKSSPIISLILYRLKYCLKGSLKLKQQQQQQHKFKFGYSLKSYNCQCEMANRVGLDQTALYEYFHLDLHYSQRHLSRY